MGQALYRKYRSRSLDELVGQEHITATLAAALKSGRISHAYLFTGPRGTGKTSVARILAHEINQLPYADQPHLDIIEIDAASNRRIDDIRDLREKVHLAPTSAPYKVYIIDEVHMLTGESFNALLKTLEEPPSHVVFILATTEAHKLPATIISRTQRYSFKPMTLDGGIAHLKKIANKEQITIDEDALRLVAEHGAGSYRDSLSLLDQLANSSAGPITTTVVEQMLGLAPRKALQELLAALQAGSRSKVVQQLQALQAAGVSAAALVPQLLVALQTQAADYPAFYNLLDELLEVPRAYNPQVKLLTTLVSFTPQANPRPQVQATSSNAKAPFEIAKKPSELTPRALKKPAPLDTQEAEPVSPSLPHLSSLSDEAWAKVLGEVQAISPPLYSVLKQTQPLFDADTQTLTLASKYRLHITKLNDAKFRAELVKAFTASIGATPIIKTELRADAKPLDVIPAKASVPPLNETSQSVAAIMGGGEAV